MLLLQAASAPKYKAAFATAYGAGLRVAEVVALKVGRSAEGAAAARSHTGKLAGSDRVVNAVFRQCGVTRVDDWDDLEQAIVLARKHDSKVLVEAAVLGREMRHRLDGIREDEMLEHRVPHVALVRGPGHYTAADDPGTPWPTLSGP